DGCLVQRSERPQVDQPDGHPPPFQNGRGLQGLSEQETIDENGNIGALTNDFGLSRLERRRMRDGSPGIVEADIAGTGVLYDGWKDLDQLVFVCRAEDLHPRYRSHQRDIFDGLMSRAVCL